MESKGRSSMLVVLTSVCVNRQRLFFSLSKRLESARNFNHMVESGPASLELEWSGTELYSQSGHPQHSQGAALVGCPH